MKIDKNNCELWDAIDQYVRACGGNPETKKTSAKRLVPVIEQKVRLYRRDAFENGITSVYHKIPSGTECDKVISSFVNLIRNPFETGSKTTNKSDDSHWDTANNGPLKFGDVSPSQPLNCSPTDSEYVSSLKEALIEALCEWEAATQFKTDKARIEEIRKRFGLYL